MNKRIVTSYEEPDLDGVSSMYAYSEYLNKIGISSDYYIKGNPKKEVEIVCDLFGIDLLGCEEILEEQEAVLLDTNNLEEAPFLEPEQIVEIIDHHSKNKSSDECKNAKIHIERLGAVATLITEKFKKNNIPLSRESAILLYYGIISNSINLKASITNEKDINITLDVNGISDITECKIIKNGVVWEDYEFKNILPAESVIYIKFDL